MKVLFLTTGRFENIEQKGIYPDLLRVFAENGDDVYVVSTRERRQKKATELVIEANCIHLLLKIGNLTQTNLLEKGVSLLTLEGKLIKGIKKYFNNVKFDLVLYSTPPITFCRAVAFVKRRDKAKTYLMLKDIFPQNAIDLGILKKTGFKGILYRYFRKKEKNFYVISDKIGCMSEANVEYILKHNQEIDKNKVEVCPNSIEVLDKSISEIEKKTMRKKYEIPSDKIVFVYGGNLGRPQGIDFLIKCLKEQKENSKVFFLIVGSGTEYKKIRTFIKDDKPKNVKLMSALPKEDYDRLVGSCDVGMIFLDYRFTIPNFPSRLLSYMQAKLPVLAATDINTDIGTTITEGGFGWWCESSDVNEFDQKIQECLKSNLYEMGEKGFWYLKNYYSVERSYKIIKKSISQI